jgi:hypothetical protein
MVEFENVKFANQHEHCYRHGRTPSLEIARVLKLERRVTTEALSSLLVSWYRHQ